MNFNEKKLDVILSDESLIQIQNNRKLVQSLKRLCSVYPATKKSRFVAELVKDKSTTATFKNLWSVYDRFLILLWKLQEGIPARREDRFTKDNRVKVICKSLNELEAIIYPYYKAYQLKDYP